MSTISGIGAQSASQLTRNAFQPPSFASLDKNGDNSLTLSELELNVPKGASSAQGKSRAEALFSAMDSDSNGSVTSSEKDAFDVQMANRRQTMAFMAQQMSAPSNADIFADTDTDSDGLVSLAELGADDAATSISSEGLQKLFDLIDADGDGSITESESSEFLDAVKTALQDTSSATGSPPPGGPPRGGPPPGGPPPASSEEDDDAEDSTTTSLLATAQNAYTASAQQTLLEQLTSIFSTSA
jgi:Ca2+-binding EF-hand superfamily protein